MASAVEAIAGRRIREGLVVTKDGHADAAGDARLPVRETAHPIPDARSEAAGRELQAIAARARPQDVLLVLLSGGASALTACPAPGLHLADLAATTSGLLESGADIEELNTVRKHLSAVSGGRLVEATASRRIEVLALSDVPGDRLDVIASGPCAADASTYADAIAALRRRALWAHVPVRVRRHLESGVRGEITETLKPGDARLERVVSHIIARNGDALVAAATAAHGLGLRPVVLGSVLRGEARVAGVRLARLATCVRTDGPLLLIAGGETTVHVRGAGRGGRNQELALAAALDWNAVRGDLGAELDLSLLAVGTDGGDGPTPAAGAWVDRETVSRGASVGADAGEALETNDSHGFFMREGGVIITGPTGTNVMDVALVSISPRSRARGARSE
jgi:glycerate-2-kinase